MESRPLKRDIKRLVSNYCRFETAVLDGQHCENHFKSLFQGIDHNIDHTLQKIETPINYTLNQDFNMTELKNVIKELNHNKAVGPDSIAAEFIKLAPNEILEIILKFLNLNLKNGITCSQWCLDLIALILKDS